MASSAKTLPKTRLLRGPSSLLLLPATTKMSWQRLRHGWPLLLATWLGLVALVMLICAEPLFGRITVAAQVQDLARASQDGPTFTVTATSVHLTASQVQQAQSQVDQWAQAQLGSQVSASNLLALKTPNLSIVGPKNAQGAVGGGAQHALSGGPPPSKTPGNVLAISAYDPAEIAGLLQVMAGRLPDANSAQLEIAVSEKTARNLHLQVGSQVSVRYPLAANSIVWQLRVVGIIKLLPAAGDFWHNNVNGTTINNPNNSDGMDQGDGTTLYNALAARQVVLPALSNISFSDSTQGAFFLIWRYTFKLTNPDLDTIATLTHNFNVLQNGVSQGASAVRGLDNMWIQPPDFITRLYSLQSSLVALQILSFFLLCVTIGLALLTIGTMAQALVERQVAAIATMRSRGVQRGQIFWAFASQGIVLVLLAAGVGPLLALLLVSALATSLLSGANQATAQVFLHNLPLALSVARWDILVVAILALLTLLIAINRATKIDIVTLRREAARNTQPSFWKRIHLDIILALLTCLGYGVYIYTFVSPYANKTIVHSLQELFSLIATPLILIAVTLLFLRALPLFFRLVTRLAARSSNTPALLAFAQMERAPRAASRLLLILVVALASACYLLGLAGTQQAWYESQASFQVGADFQGELAQKDTSQQTLAQLTQRYGDIPGVQAASVGYRDSMTYNTNSIHWPELQFQLVDANTYASTARWSTDYSQQSLANLMQNLKAHRADATDRDAVYVYADAAMWGLLDLSPGTTLTVPMPGYQQNRKMHLVVLGEITNVPGIATSSQEPYAGMSLLADYQGYAAVYAKDNPGAALAPNMVWLRTASDAASLNSVRRAVPGFLDRRALLAAAQSEAGHVNLLLIFNLGTAVALGLALLGMLIVSRASIASRRTNFAALRALGMAPRQIAALLIWEHGVLYALALALGLGLGWLISFNVVPAFTLLSQLIFSYDNPERLSGVPQVHLNFPLAQAALLFGALLILNLLGLILMARAASRPALSQVLRLNED